MRTAVRRILAGGLVALSLLALGAVDSGHASRAAAATSDSLTAGSVLAAGQQLQSADGSYLFVMQSDGNAVVYSSGGTALWSTLTNGNPGASLAVQTDGNLVVYTADETAIWSSGTRGSGGSTLVMQTDGNLVLYAPSGAPAWASGTRQAAPSPAPKPPNTPAPATGADRLTPGAVLAPGQSLQSGNFSLVMQGDGNLVLYSVQGNALWNSQTNHYPGAFATLQTDGNIVVYASGVAVWATGTRGSGGSLLILQGDGNLVLYTSGGRPAWASWTLPPLGSNDNPAPQATLRAGQQLSAGTSLTSVNGAYVSVLQGDGNFVIYAGGRPLWASNSAGWSNDRFVLQGDGNFVLYSATGSPVWATGTRGSGANQLIMGDDGNLRLFTPPGQVVWQTSGTPWPLLFPPATSAPPVSTSRYLRDLTGNAATDAPLMRARGCADGAANAAGRPYLVVLHIGAQFSNIGGGWGVMLSATSRSLSNAALVTALKGYIDGYRSCMAGYSLLTLAIATNNDSGQYCGSDPYCNNPVPPAGVPDPLGGSGGSVWAQQVINPLAAYAAGSQITVAGGNDIEPGFNGLASQAYAWTSSFLAATGQPYVFIGSADGCPFNLYGQTGACNWGWSQQQLYDLSFGLGGSSRMIPMPQIYNNNLAMQWPNISNVGVRNGGAPITFGGPLTEVVACQQAGPCGSMSGPAAWNALWTNLNAMSTTRIGGMPYSTDLRIN